MSSPSPVNALPLAVFEGWAFVAMAAGDSLEFVAARGRFEGQRLNAPAASRPPCEHRAGWGILSLAAPALCRPLQSKTNSTGTGYRPRGGTALPVL
jgi:hypothetical protein